MALTASSLFTHVPVRLAAELLESLLVDYPKRNFQVRLWDGTKIGTEQPRFTLVLAHPGVVNQIAVSASELTLGRAYVVGDLDVEGDVEAAFDLGDFLIARRSSNGRHSRLAGVLQKFSTTQEESEPGGAILSGVVHSKARDRQAISYHYDLPAEFFALWLDRRMVYSCAYFAGAEESDLNAAQERKLDYICRKLRLRRGDRLLDIGCGWGGLLIHAAGQYGVQARGVTLSVPQAELARQRIGEMGLSDRCRVDVCDYRDLELDQEFDKIVSIGMFEHVGGAHLSDYFSRVWRLLRPGGAFLNHGISASATYHRASPSFVERYVFPDGDLIPLNTSLEAAETCGFELRDVESLREHYVLTLRHWVRRLEEHAEQAKHIAGEANYRIWRLYMAGSAQRFRTAKLNLYQLLFAKPVNGESGMPLTRADWYRD